MPVIELVNWSVTCDTCYQVNDVQDGESPESPVGNRRQAEQHFRRLGWVVGQDRNLCPNCNPKASGFRPEFRDYHAERKTLR